MITRVQTFITVVETGSFTQAAQILGITQPAASQQIKKLEGELEAKLLTRDGQLCVPTDAGAFFYGAAKPLLSDFTNLCNAVRDLPATSSSTLRFGTRSALFSPVFQVLVNALKASNPKIKIEVEKYRQSRGHLYAVENGEADAALSHSAELEDEMNLDFFHVCNSYLACVVPLGHKFAGKASVTMNDLAGEHMVLHQYMKDSTARQRNRIIYREIYNTHSSPADITFTDGAEIAMMLARSGLGITVVDSTQLVSMEGCLAIPLHENCFTENGFFVRRGPRSENVKALINATANAFDEPMIIDSGGKMTPKRVFLEQHPIYLV